MKCNKCLLFTMRVRKFACIFFLFSIMIMIRIESNADVDVSKTRVWGPGLSPTHLVFPARYFFVQLYEKNNTRLREPPNGNIDMHISGESTGRLCRVWKNILDRKDGSYIIRYKVYNTCNSFKIDLRYNNEPIKGFPLNFNKMIYSDDCFCPQRLQNWLKHMECKGTYKQITDDLSKFRTVNFESMRQKIIAKFNHSGSISLCHYVLKSNEVYRKCYGEYVGFKVFMDAILLSLARKVFLPDIELFVNLGDWPLEKNSANPLPIFSWCGSDSTSDIVMPTYDLTEATLECMGRVLLDMLSVQSNSGPKWTEKINKAFWRGRDSRPERLDLIDISRKYPNLLDAALTNFFFFRDKEREYGPKVEHISFFDFFQYKYQVNVDGTVAAYRLPYLLAGNSVVLKQDSEYFEHFYKELVPGIHYVPFKRDLSDLVEKINWLMVNDDVAFNISQQAQKYARENLMPKDVFCYYAVLFKEWSSRLMQSPRVFEEMERVPQPTPAEPCSCHRFFRKDEL